MRALRLCAVPVLVGALLSLLGVSSAAAAPGAIGQECLSGDRCDAGLTCVDLDAGAAVAKRCTRTCTDTGIGSRDCPEPTSCVDVPGTGRYCVDLTGATWEGSFLTDTDSPGGPPTEPASNSNVPFTPVAPTLALPIPTFGGFSTLQVQDVGGSRFIDIPFVAEYVVALYRYAIGILVTLGTVMVVVAGFQYLTARGNASVIQAARGRILNALIGIGIALGSYLILAAINPELVNFRNIRVNLIQTVDVESVLRTTSEATGSDSPTNPECDPSSGGYAPGASGSSAGGGSCPVSLEAPFVDGGGRRPERTEEFFREYGSASVSGGTPRERVIRAAQAAASCELVMGSCGNTVESIYELAGVRLRTTHEIGSENVRYLLSINTCERGDRTCKQAARCSAYDRFEGDIDGWPDAWARELQPGDAFWIYNANAAPAGQHAAVFMGWAGGGRANVVQGGNSGETWRVRGGTICITSACGGVLTRTQRPE